MIVLRLSPFVKGSQDFISFLSSLVLALSYFAGILLVNENFDSSSIGTILIVMSCSVLTLQLGSILIIKTKILEKAKKWAAKRKGGSLIVVVPKGTLTPTEGDRNQDKDNGQKAKMVESRSQQIKMELNNLKSWTVQ